MSLTNGMRLPADHSVVSRSLRRLSKEALVELAMKWAEPRNQGFSSPLLDPSAAGSGNLSGPARTLEDLREVYVQLLADKASKKEVLERIQEIDWKNGLSLWQLAEADTRDMIERPMSARWTAFKLSINSVTHEGTLQKHASRETIRTVELSGRKLSDGLQKDIGGIFKLHFHTSRLQLPEMNVLRVLALNGAHHFENDLIFAADGGQVGLACCWLAFRDVSTDIYVSPPVTAQETNHHDLRNVIVDSIPRIISTAKENILLQPHESNSGPLSEIDSLVRKYLKSNTPKPLKWREEPCAV